MSLDGRDRTAPTRQYELDHADHTDQEYVYICPFEYLDNYVRGNDL